MDNRLKILTIFLLSIFAISYWGRGETLAHMSFFDGRLEVKGRFEIWNTWRIRIPRKEKDFHDTRLGCLLNAFQIEGLYHLVENRNLIINLFGYFRYYHEAAPDIDRELRSGIDPWVRSRYQEHHFRDDDPIQELYIDIITGPWTFRLGKQIVVWGETGLKRTCDVVNPLDFRYGLPGVLEFEDMKTGIWMIKTMYESMLPADLIFEVIWIPSDYENFKIPFEGTYLGAGLTGEMSDGLFTELQKKWYEDEPGHQLKYGEGGLRIRGYSWNLDWTIEYFNTIDDTPSSRKGKLDIANTYPPIWMMTKPDSGIDPSVPLNIAQMYGFKNPQAVKDAWKSNRVFAYRRTQYFGATFQTYVEAKWLKSIVRGEFVYQMGKKYAKKNYDTGAYYDIVERDAFNYGINISRPTFWPKWLMKLTGYRSITYTFQVFQDWIFNHDHDLSISGRGRGDRNVTTLTFDTMCDFMKQTLTVVTKNLYDTSGTGYSVIAMVYGPGDHWRYDLGYINFYSFVDWEQESASHDKDFVYFKLRYEF